MTKRLRFLIPACEFQLERGQWFWDLVSWPYVKRPVMQLLTAGTGSLTLETTRRVATERVRQFCEEQGFEETKP